MTEPPASRPHYPAPVRALIELHASGRLPLVEAVEVEPEYGHAARVRYRDGSIRLVRGHDLGINTAAASQIAKDKGYTRFFLQHSGFVCPTGASFLLPWWAARIGPRLRDQGLQRLHVADEARAYARDVLGYPVSAKPADGSKGIGVYRCEGEDDLDRAMAEYEAERVRVAVVEESVELPDFRVVVLHGEVFAAYQRTPLMVLGDGRRRIADLLTVAVDDRVTRRLAREGLDLSSVPAAGQTVRLLDISNLSAGGSAIELTAALAPRWAQLAVRIARTLGLDLCGVDLACPDLTAGAGGYSILEVNAEPGLEHYAAIGPEQAAAVRALYAAVFSSPAPGMPGAGAPHRR